MARKKKQVKAKPFPEAIDGRQWTIQESPSPRQAGAGDGLMIVPMGTELRERGVRLHETMHVKITPAMAILNAARDLGLPEDILQNCEDARVHGQLRRIGFRDEVKALEGVISDFEIGQIVKNATPTQLAGLGAAMSGTGEYERLYNEILKETERIDNQDKAYAFATGKELAIALMHRPKELPSFDQTTEMCSKIVELFGDPGRPDEPAVTNTVTSGQVFETVQKLAVQGKLDQLTVKQPAPTKQGGHTAHQDEVGWRNMNIVEPPLTIRMPQKMRVKPRKIPEAYGRRLRRVGRLYHDGRVFTRKLRKPGGGAVLIDVSGSMELTVPNITHLMEQFPGGVIATYCGQKDGKEGWLTVVARNGKRCEESLMKPRGKYNAIDGPALDWIAKHPGPRYWISDALVHGGAIGLAYCVRVCAQHNITRVDNAWEILGR